MTFYLILFFIGGFIFVCSMFNSGSYGALVFDRNYFCPEKFRTLQKATDIVSIIHCFSSMIFSAFIMAFSLMNTVVLKGGEYNIQFVNTLFEISLFSALIDFFVNTFVTAKYNMTKVRDDILTQWETQKVITEDNDHEVNLYNGCKRVTMKYPLQNMVTIIGLMIYSFIR